MFNIPALQNSTQMNLAMFKTISYSVLIGGAGLGLIAGILGMAFTCCKTKCFAASYGILLTISWLALITFGCIVTAV